MIVIPGTGNRRVYRLTKFDGSSATGENSGKLLDPGTLDDVNLVSSRSISHKDIHFPVFDIDVPHALIPSSTVGHSHLYFGVATSWENYALLLDAMQLCGILEPGYVRASKDRKFTAVRAPWVQK